MSTNQESTASEETPNLFRNTQNVNIFGGTFSITSNAVEQRVDSTEIAHRSLRSYWSTFTRAFADARRNSSTMSNTRTGNGPSTSVPTGERLRRFLALTAFTETNSSQQATPEVGNPSRAVFVNPLQVDQVNDIPGASPSQAGLPVPPVQSDVVRPNYNGNASNTQWEVEQIMRADYDIYYHQLLVKRKGSPMWIPGPDLNLPTAYRREGIKIGDVGILYRSEGFTFLFNIFLPADHPINQGRVPDSFEPLDWARLQFGLKQQVIGKEEYITSSSVRKLGSIDSSGFIFETSATEGAILIMPDDGITEDLTSRSSIREYLAENAEDWYEFVNRVWGLEIGNGDIRLVIGFDKVPSWGIATFASSVGEQARLEFNIHPRGRAVSPSQAYRWNCIGSGSGRVGPHEETMRDLRRETDGSQLRNQCVFVRTLNLDLSGEIWEDSTIHQIRSSDRFSGPPPPTRNRPPDYSGGRGGSGTASRGPGTGGLGIGQPNCSQGYRCHSMEFRLPVFHPSKLINKSLLKMCPKAKMAITEDANWISLIREDDVEFPSPEELCSRLLASRGVYEKDGIVTIRAGEELPVNDATAASTVLHRLTSTTLREVGLRNMSVYTTPFVINTQEKIREKFVNHIVPEAFDDSANNVQLQICYPGTREAIMRVLIHWVENNYRTHPIYHLYAPGGSGKTAIAKTLANYFGNYEGSDPSRNSLLATFYFSRMTESRSNARAFIATIAYQVAKNLPPVATYIMEAATGDPAIFDKDIFVQMRTLLLNPLRKACTVELESGQATSNWPQLFVIDGLDECHNTETQIDILRVITELARFRPFPLAILLSCRPEVHIRNTFTEPHLSILALKTDLSRYDSEGDIRMFLVSKFTEIRNSHRAMTGIILPSDWPGADIIGILVRKSSGHFIYPSVVVKYVGALDDNPADRLNVVLGLPESSTDSPTVEERPFRQLDALYSQILSSIKPHYLPTVMDAFSFALVPYGGFMLLDEPKTKARLANLKGILFSVLNHRRKGRRDEIAVAFLHSSFIDFLLDPARSGPYHIDLRGAHANVAVYLIKNYVEDNTGKFKRSSARAIYSLIGHLRVAAPTEALLHILHHMSEVTNFTKIFNNCNRADDLGLLFDVWKVLQSLANCLGQLVFEESSIMKVNLLRTMECHLHKELEKYNREPLNQLIALLMCGARLPEDFLGQRPPSESSAKEALVSLISQKFSFLDVRTTDEPPLNPLVLLKADQACLRKLLAETGYTVDRDVYTTACINALECLAEISGGSGRNVNLSYEFDSFRQAAEAAQQNQEEAWWWLDYIPLASLFTHFFTDFVVRLLEHADPSEEIANYLDDLEDDITLLCRCANRVNMHGVREGEKARAVVRHHRIMGNYSPSPYSSRKMIMPVSGKPVSRNVIMPASGKHVSRNIISPRLLSF